MLAKYRYTTACLLALMTTGALFAFSRPVAADGNTITVCASGCDYTTLTDALAHPGLNNDTIQLTAGYVFVAANEDTTIFFPSNVTVEAMSGADTFGDAAETKIQIYHASNNTIQNMTFENVDFDASSTTNTNWLNNTISAAASSKIVLTNASDFEISGNTNVQNIRLQTADDGLITNNSMACNFNESCFASSIAGGGVDYGNDAQISNNIDITNNTITNYNVNSFGDYINIVAGANINITGNTFSSAVTINDNYNTTVSISNSEVYFANNYFIAPDKGAAANQGTWPINLRVGDGDMHVTAEHNTMILKDTTGTALANSTCFGLYDDGTHPNPTIQLDAHYNLCYFPSDQEAGEGRGAFFDYDTDDMSFTFNNSYNGIYGVNDLIDDTSGTYTSLAGTTVTTDPVLRTENVSTSDDADPVPMSRYFDVNGALDIGAKSAARLTSYTIDDDCIVDYTSCHSQDITLLSKVLKNGDTVTIGAGTYDPFSLTQSYSNVTIQGVGATTIFDATGETAALSFTGLTNSTVQSLAINNANTTTTEYEMFSYHMEAGGTVYNDDGNSGVLPPQYSYNTCASSAFFNPPNATDMTGIAGIGTHDIALVLVNIPPGTFGQPNDMYLTVYISEVTGSTPAEIEAACGFPVSFFDYFVGDIFKVQPDGTYIFDSAALTTAGITIQGDGSTPYINKIVTESYGLRLTNSSGNTFSEITFTNNTNDVLLDVDSDNNTFKDLTFTGSTTHVISQAATDNYLQNSQFDFAKLQISAAGDIGIYYTLQVTVQDPDLNPVNAANVTVRNAASAIVANLVTDGAGQTPVSIPILATVLTQGGVFNTGAGGKNPFSIAATKDGYGSTLQQNITLSTPSSSFTLTITTTPEGLGGGGFASADSPAPENTPSISVSKLADPAPGVLTAPGPVVFTYSLRNTGTVAVANVQVVDSACAPIAYVSGDVNSNGVLETTEIWQFRCETVIEKKTKCLTTATARAGEAEAVSVTECTYVLDEVKGDSKIALVAHPYPITLPPGGGQVRYTYQVSNPGPVALSGVVLTSNQCQSAFESGDVNMNQLLDPGEVWTYRCGAQVSAFTVGTAHVVAQSQKGQVEAYAMSAVRLEREADDIAFGDGYRFALIDQSPYPAAMKPGEVANVWIEVKNTGTLAWRNDGPNPVRLGAGSAYGSASQQRDYSSEVANDDWLSPNRPTTILHPVIEPGWHTRFQFNLKAPNVPGTYKAYFTPVVDGLTWMRDIGIYWGITVSP